MQVCCDEAEFPRNRSQEGTGTEMLCEADAHQIVFFQQARGDLVGLSISNAQCSNLVACKGEMIVELNWTTIEVA